MPDATEVRLLHHAKEDVRCNSFGFRPTWSSTSSSCNPPKTLALDGVVTSNRYLLTISAALVALYGLQSANFGQELLDAAYSCCRDSRFRPLVSDHKVTRRPEHSQVQGDSRARATSAGGDVQV